MINNFTIDVFMIGNDTTKFKSQSLSNLLAWNIMLTRLNLHHIHAIDVLAMSMIARTAQVMTPRPDGLGVTSSQFLPF